ncbi:hypothetical protein EA472_20660 [Natrarchaeobius oligotrophus]|uniref:Uncharacterized protein n=1 Tax=Natrarchaeobius chitinivorans TaxID=1679083 RepID=A0A3N6MNX6_NATCH|nr:hypothetical protein EA472_20660 [Natrarchaeobius chitinivorans]
MLRVFRRRGLTDERSPSGPAFRAEYRGEYVRKSAERTGDRRSASMRINHGGRKEQTNGPGPDRLGV